MTLTYRERPSPAPSPGQSGDRTYTLYIFVTMRYACYTMVAVLPRYFARRFFRITGVNKTVQGCTDDAEIRWHNVRTLRFTLNIVASK